MRTHGTTARTYIQQVTNEGGFANGVLAHEQHHGFSREIAIVELRRVKFVKFVRLFEWKQFGFVDLSETFGDIIVDLLLRVIFLPERHLERIHGWLRRGNQ